MEISISRNNIIDVNMYSNSDSFEVEDFNCEVNRNILTVISKIRVTTDFSPYIELLFEVTSNIDLDKIDESTYIDLPIDDYEFINSNFDIDNLEDINKIITTSGDTCILGVETNKLTDFIKKDPSILDNLILLIDKANVNHSEYDKNDVDSVVESFYNIINDKYKYIDEYFYSNIKKIDPIIADKVMTSIQKIVKEEWDPYIGDGLDDELKDNISIGIDFDE